MGAVASFREIRIAKTGDSGEIFTGIGRVGRTHRLLWSDFSGVGDRELATYSSGRFSRTTHYVGLNGTSMEYKFGSELNRQQQAFVSRSFASTSSRKLAATECTAGDLVTGALVAALLREALVRALGHRRVGGAPPTITSTGQCGW